MRTFRGHAVSVRPLPPAEKKVWQQALSFSLAFMLLFLLWASRDASIFSDDAIQNWYGYKVLDYYLTFGADKTALTNKANICYYGGLFDMVTTIAIRLLGTEVYATRHFIVALTGFGTIVFTAKLAKLFGGYKAALATAWLLFLSPRFFGDSLNNPKDIPYAMGMMMGIYCIVRLSQSGPALSARWAVYTTLSVGFAISMRIGGLLLVPFLGVAMVLEWLYQWRPAGLFTTKLFFKGIAICAAIALGGYLLGSLAWPWALQNPIVNPLKSLKLMTNAYLGSTVLFNGTDYISWIVPWNYVPVYMAISTPLPVVAAFLLLPFAFMKQSFPRHRLFFLLFTLLFPWLYVVIFRSPLYDGWRHFLFLYPLVVLFAVLALLRLAAMLQAGWLKGTLWVLVMLGMLPAVQWSVKNHPLQSIYYNSLVGGLHGAYGRYETDVCGNGLAIACQRFAKAARLDERQDTVIVATNFQTGPPYYLLRRWGKKIRMVHLFYQNRYDVHWDYAIFRSRGVDCYLLQNKAWPPKCIDASFKVDGAILYAIAERSGDTTDVMLAGALKTHDWANAARYAEHIIRTDTRNETVYARYARALMMLGRKEEALAQVQVMLRINPFDEMGRKVYTNLTGKEYPVQIKLPPPPTDMRWIFSREPDDAKNSR